MRKAQFIKSSAKTGESKLARRARRDIARAAISIVSNQRNRANHMVAEHHSQDPNQEKSP